MASNWNEIKTAPSDRWIYIKNSEGHECAAKQTDNDDIWVDDTGAAIGNVIQWKPLPVIKPRKRRK